MGRLCLLQTERGQVLSACAACYGIKMSCKTSMGTTTGRKEVEELAIIGTVKEEAGEPEWAEVMDKTEEMPV